jgi:lycopene beta-cyclase
VAAELTDVDVAIVGAGGAGLSLVMALERAAGRAGIPAPSMAVLDPVHRREPDRTWCWWMPSAQPGTGPSSLQALDPLLARSWSRMALIDRTGAAREYDLADRRYVMLRSSEFYAAADAALDRLNRTGSAARITEPVERVIDGPDVAVVHAGALQVRARWVFDSRPAGRSVSTGRCSIRRWPS